MDVVIPFQHSINKDEELKFTLRSIDKHINGIGHAWIIGDIPLWRINTSNLTVINFGNRYNGEDFAHRNVANKMMAACADERISENFLMAHDDNFIMAPCDADVWPYYSVSRRWEGKGAYAKTEANTHGFFGSYRIENFDLHCPHPMNKLDFVSAIKQPDWSVPGGYCIKTIYGVTNKVNSEFYTDLKIKFDATLQEIEKLVTAGRRFFSCADRPFMYGIKQFLADKFPEKSKYEL